MSPIDSAPKPKKITTTTFQSKKDNDERITMLTAYDFGTAAVMDAAGIDSILVGDSLGMVVLGYENTLPVTMDDMVHHCKAVARAVRCALTIGDLPFLSYQVSVEDAVRNAGRLLQEAGMDTVKLEGGRERLPVIEAIVGAGIPVMGHLGLTPQSVHQLGGFHAQGRTASAARKLIDDASALQEAGCFSIVLEAIPARLAELVSSRLQIPTIGIGAGVGCDGQVLVTHDLLGAFDRFTPRFVKQYANLHGEMHHAFITYKQEVERGEFPTNEHSFEISDDVWDDVLEELGDK